MTPDQTLKALIFDFDGLIIDTEMPHYEAWKESWEAHGHELPLETYVQCVGSDHNAFDPMRELEVRVGSSLNWDHLDQKRRNRVASLLEDKTALPGVEAMLQEAHALGLACAIASSSPAEWVRPWLEKLGLTAYFEHIVTLDDVTKPKPSPELFETAAARLGVSHEEVIIFEDSQNGLRAAQAAGIPCVIIPNEVTRHLDFEGATLLMESMTHLSVDRLNQHLSN